MNFKKIIFFILLLYPNFSVSEEVNIVAKVDNEIITNIDVQNQIKFLLIINNKLNELSKSQLLELSKKTLIKEEIKKKEINKYFQIKKSPNLGEKLVQEKYLSLGFSKKIEFTQFLKAQKISYEFFKNKLFLDKLWNTLIFEKFQNRVRIDKNKLRIKIINYSNNLKNNNEFNLSEILFSSLSEFNKINDFINKYGFENAAIKFSISDTSSLGGKIGWINPRNLNAELKNKIMNINVGQITEPLKISNGYIILKLNSSRKIKTKVNIEEELNKLINYERNQQLNRYSMNYFNRIEKNTSIYEY